MTNDFYVHNRSPVLIELRNIYVWILLIFQLMSQNFIPKDKASNCTFVKDIEEWLNIYLSGLLGNLCYVSLAFKLLMGSDINFFVRLSVTVVT